MTGNGFGRRDAARRRRGFSLVNRRLFNEDGRGRECQERRFLWLLLLLLSGLYGRGCLPQGGSRPGVGVDGSDGSD